jgi:hypothetical protein
MHKAKLITQAGYEAKLKNKKLNHSFRQPQFWQCNVSGSCFIANNRVMILLVDFFKEVLKKRITRLSIRKGSSIIAPFKSLLNN